MRVFFFSSRRRHTRYWRDWSSDVCSSDLSVEPGDRGLPRGGRRMKFGVIVFPGSNCDHDAYHVISKHVGQPVDFIWHRETDLSTYDAVIIPGGFSYGDYLRAGALASFSPVMSSVKEFAERGRIVLGICNGFQILCESGLLPGALIRNKELHFICQHVNVRVETTETPFTHMLHAGQVLNLPIAHRSDERRV